MKKFFLVTGIIVVLIIAWGMIKSAVTPPADESTDGQPTSTEQQTTLKPFEITVGIFDPEAEPSKLTKLLESRLKEIGFKVSILKELVDPNAAEQEKTTLLYRPSTIEALRVVEKMAINSSLYRQGQNEAILQDVVISAWNIEDINWGSFQALAEQYASPQPADISVQVVNAGASAGAAEALAELLQTVGYVQVKIENAPAEQKADQPALIFYQRNYKNAAKALRQLLNEHQYDNVSYRVELIQPANINIVLGPTAATSSTPTAVAPTEQ